MANGGWIGVDLDGTLAHYTEYAGPEEIGDPVPLMLTRVQEWLSQGADVRIFTARASHPDMIPPINRWCMKHLGQTLPVTNVKDFQMVELWDDRAIQVKMNTGLRVDRMHPKDL